MSTAAVVDPWTWLLGRTPGGLWRHVPYQALDPGQGQDPALEPRVEVIRRLIAYPGDVFQSVLVEVMAQDRPDAPVRWLCYREPGSSPARPYWLCFVTGRGDGTRRFHLGLELFDRERLGVWFLSGYDAASVPPELRAPFPSRPELSLPRLELTSKSKRDVPLAAWIADAWRERLCFTRQSAVTPPRVDPSGSADQSGILNASMLAITPDVDAGRAALPARAARARLLLELTGTGPKPPTAATDDGDPNVALFPVGRLVTLIGRDPRGDVVVEDRSVSNEHARIVWRDGVPGLEDLGSKNGTAVEGARLSPGQTVELPSEARLDIGTVRGLFVRDPEAPAAPVEAGQTLPPHRHAHRVRALVAQQVITEADAAEALTEASQRGITPGEVLLLSGKVKFEQWAPPRGSCGILLLAALALALAGCHSFAIPPFYEQDLDPAPTREGSREVEWDWDVGLRPLFQARAVTGVRSETHVLFPLGLMDRRPGQSETHLYPIYQNIHRTDPDGFRDDDTILFPLLVAGSHPVEGDYAYIVPFGGSLKGLLGKDEAVGVLFPLYGWTRQGETETHHVAWPLFATTSGGGWSGFRALPFYGHFEKKDAAGQTVFDRTTVLWPLVSWAEDATNSRNPFSSVAVFPFYGRTRSGWMDDDVLLWPLFRWWSDKRTGYSERRVPFPFVIVGSGGGEARVDLWPLCGLRTRPGYTRHFFLWPLGRREEQHTESYVDVRTWALPLFWQFHRTWLDRPGEDREVHVWPFARWDSRADGSRGVRFPALLFFNDPNSNFDEIIDPLFSLFRWRREADGAEALDVALGIWRTRDTADGEHRWDVLGGLVGRTTGPRGSKTRLLWFVEL